jgi:Cu(I)/Ag(I) efflux system periplasmic protein CusF
MKGISMKPVVKFVAPVVASVAASLTLALGCSSAAAAAAAPAPSATKSATMSSGQVKKIDKDVGKITIKHGPLDNLGMPAMTMVFHVADPAMLEQVKPGDKIAFIAERKDGALTVVKMEAAQ